jgi:hypothetical protein
VRRPTVAEELERCFGPIRYAELSIDRREVKLDGMHADIQVLSDLKVGLSL